MTHARIGTILLAVGLAVGSGASVALRPPALAVAEQSMAGMSAGSKSAGDTEMSAAMERMAQGMSKVKLTGSQDRDFMTMMILHHQSAIDMANVELRRGTRSELKTLSHDIIKSQGAEISQMRNWLKSWYGVRS